MTKAVRRGEVWAVDFEPQTHRQEPGKKERPALVIQTDALNKAGHPTTIVVPGTSQVDALPPGDHFPLRVRDSQQIPMSRAATDLRPASVARRQAWIHDTECLRVPDVRARVLFRPAAMARVPIEMSDGISPALELEQPGNLVDFERP